MKILRFFSECLEFENMKKKVFKLWTSIGREINIFCNCLKVKLFFIATTNCHWIQRE